MNAGARRVQRVYLVLLLLHTLAASFIWGINDPDVPGVPSAAVSGRHADPDSNCACSNSSPMASAIKGRASACT